MNLPDSVKAVDKSILSELLTEDEVDKLKIESQSKVFTCFL